jgi:VanZ family protein
LWLAGLFLLLVPFVLPIPSGLQRNFVLRSLGSQLHVFLFLGLTLLLYRRPPWAGRLVRVVLSAVFLGAFVEILQPLAGRAPRWKDFGFDLVGIGLGVCWILWRERRQKVALGLGLILALTVPARWAHLPGWVAAQKEMRAHFPRLADFETDRQLALWGESHDGHQQILDLDQGRCLRLSAIGPAKWPGVFIRGFPQDWREYHHLEFRARLVEAPRESVTIGVRLDDFPGRVEKIWAWRVFKTGRDWHTFRVDLKELAARTRGRPVDLGDVWQLLFYLPSVQKGTLSVDLDDVRLF